MKGKNTTPNRPGTSDAVARRLVTCGAAGRRGARPAAFALTGLALASLAGCLGGTNGPVAPDPGTVGDRSTSAVHGAWKHGEVVKEAQYDFTKAKWSGMECSKCHSGGPDGKPAYASGPPSCWACHAGGPDGSPDHPIDYLNPTSPFFHGAAVREAGYDYTRALAGYLTCSACHAGESPGQISPNSRAPSCFPCHAGGPTGSAGHPVGWASLRGGVAVSYSGVQTCRGCHSGHGSPTTGDISATVIIEVKRLTPSPSSTPSPSPSPGPSPSPSPTPSATPSPTPSATPSSPP